jgi:hypothetical protein
MVKQKDLICFDLFSSLNCTVRPVVIGSISSVPKSGPLDSPHRELRRLSNAAREPFKEKDKEREKDDITNFDKDKMMSHILDCLSALKRVEELCDEDGTLGTEVMTLNAVKGRIFRSAVNLILDSALNKNKKPDLERILQSFPDSGKLEDDRKWLSLHWSVLEDANANQDDIEVLYTADPLALTRHHLKPENDNLQGYSPGHLMAFQKNPKMSIVRFFDLHSPRAFLLRSSSSTSRVELNSDCYPVQIAAAHTESIEFLQFLLQVALITKRMTH